MALAGNANAQLGIHAGYSPESWSNENNTTNLNTFFAGVDYNTPVTGDLKVNIGAQLRYGTESSSSSVLGIAAGQHTSTLIGIDVPVLLNLGINLTSDLKTTVFAGPKLSYGLSAKTKYEGSVLGIGGSTEQNWYDANGMNLKQFNISATFGLVFEYNQFRLFGGYNYGLLDMDNANTKTTINGLFFGLGFAM